MKFLIWILVAALIIAHHDFWNWDDDQIVFGFMPIGLAYHVGISIAAALVWAFACAFAWPNGVDDFEDPDHSKLHPTSKLHSNSPADGGRS